LTLLQQATRIVMGIIRSEYASGLAKHALRLATAELVRQIQRKTKGTSKVRF